MFHPILMAVALLLASSVACLAATWKESRDRRPWRAVGWGLAALVLAPIHRKDECRGELKG